jgi:hypothetical protein
VATVFLRFRTPRRLTCPEAQMLTEVGVDPAYAAWTAAFREPVIRVKRCSLWPQRAGCGQECRTASEIATPEHAAPTVL